MDKKLFADLLESVAEMKAVRAGRAKAARETRCKALDPRVIRAKSGLTQERFAALLGVKLTTYRNWEQGRRVPRGPGRVLLAVADYDPMVIRRAILAQREEDAPAGTSTYARSTVIHNAGTAAKHHAAREAPAAYTVDKKSSAAPRGAKPGRPKTRTTNKGTTRGS